MTINVTVTDQAVQPEIYLGRQGEKNYREIVFDLDALIDKYGSGTATLYHQRSKDPAPYVVASSSTDTLTWVISETDTLYSGTGYAEFRYTFGADNLSKTTMFATSVQESLNSDVITPDSPMEGLYDAIIDYIDENVDGPLPTGGTQGQVLKKASATDYDVEWANESGGGGSSPSPSSATPQPLGTAAAGSSTDYSRADHVHAMPSASDVGALASNTTYVSTVNGSSGAVTLSIPSTAADVGAIAAPSSPSSGQFLVYNGSAWVAQSLSTWQGGSY